MNTVPAADEIGDAVFLVPAVSFVYVECNLAFMVLVSWAVNMGHMPLALLSSVLWYLMSCLHVPCDAVNLENCAFAY